MPEPTIYDCVMAVQEGRVERAIVPIENSLEGSVNATLDALAFETDEVAIVGELVHPIQHCLIASAAVAAGADRARLLAPAGERAVCALHPRPACRRPRWCRPTAPRTRFAIVADSGDQPWAALGNRLSARAVRMRGARGRRRGRARERDPVRLARARAGRLGAAPRRLEDLDRLLGPARRPRRAGRRAAGVRRAKHQPDQDRVAAAQARPRPLHLLRRSRRPTRTTASVLSALEAVGARVETLRVLGSYPAAQ